MTHAESVTLKKGKARKHYYGSSGLLIDLLFKKINVLISVFGLM